MIFTGSELTGVMAHKSVVGAVVGAVEGLVVGAEVGAVVGLEVGAVVGAVVGLVVGACVAGAADPPYVAPVSIVWSGVIAAT
jgi:outer membrane lipoprotein SlyB